MSSPRPSTDTTRNPITFPSRPPLSSHVSTASFASAFDSPALSSTRGQDEEEGDRFAGVAELKAEDLEGSRVRRDVSVPESPAWEDQEAETPSILPTPLASGSGSRFNWIPDPSETVASSLPSTSAMTAVNPSITVTNPQFTRAIQRHNSSSSSRSTSFSRPAGANGKPKIPSRPASVSDSASRSAPLDSPSGASYGWSDGEGGASRSRGNGMGFGGRVESDGEGTVERGLQWLRDQVGWNGAGNGYDRLQETGIPLRVNDLAPSSPKPPNGKPRPSPNSHHSKELPTYFENQSSPEEINLTSKQKRYRRPRGRSGTIGKERDRERMGDWERGYYSGRGVLKRLTRWIPAHILRGFFMFLLFLGVIAFVITKFLMWYLNPDKAPLPWRDYCSVTTPTYHVLSSPPTSDSLLHNAASPQGSIVYTRPSKSPLIPMNSSHPAWPWGSHFRPPHSAENESVDELEPVGIFLGIMTMDRAREKRMLIRETYGSHPRSRTRGTESLRLRFIMGRPKAEYQREIELEQETFNDLVVLDMEENMNSGKTHEFFTWAAENATVPQWEYVLPQAGKSPSSHKSQHSLKLDFGLDPHWLANEQNVYDERAETPQGKERRADKHEGLLAHDPAARLVYKGDRKPDFVFKADDDAFIRLDEFERRIRVIPRKLTFWGYLVKNQFMGGECYGMSYDLVQYIGSTQLLRGMITGKEDKLTTKWMKMHPKRDEIVWVSERCGIYDHPRAGTVYSHGFIYPSTIKHVTNEKISDLTPLELEYRGGKKWAPTYSSVTQWAKHYEPPFKGMTANERVEALVEGSEMSLLSRLESAKHARGPMGIERSHETTQEEADLIKKLYHDRPTRPERYLNDPKDRGGTVLVHFIKKQEWFMETALAFLGSRGDD